MARGGFSGRCAMRQMLKKIEGTRFYLRPKAPYNFELHQRFYSRKREQPQPEVFEEGVWRRAFRIGSRLLPIEVKAVGSVEQPLLEIAP